MEKTKWLAALAAVVLAAGFAACSNGDADGEEVETHPDVGMDADGNGEKDLSQTTEVFSVKYDVAGLADVTMKDGSKGANIQKKQGETVTADELWVVTVKDAYKGSYAFGGWCMDADCTKPFAAFEVTKHTTLYARFTAADGTPAAIKVVKYVTEKGYMDAKRIVAGTLPPSYLGCPPTSFEGSMYFAGWFIDEARTDRAEPGAEIGESGMTLYAKWAEMQPGANAAFEGTNLAGIGGLYARSAEKDSGTGEYTYTPLSKLEKKKNYYPATGVSKIGGALVFSKNMGNVSVRSDSTDGSTAAELRLDNSLNSSNVTLVENLVNYVCVRPTGAGTVTATLSNVPSSSVTGTSTAKALLIDGSGNVIAQAAIDNKQGTKTEPVTLSCTVTNAAPVYLAFGRYGDAGGQLGVKKITFTPSASSNPDPAGMQKILSAWQLREIDEDDGELFVETFYFYDNKIWMMVYGSDKEIYTCGQAGIYDGNATSGEVTCTAYWDSSELDLIKVNISGNTLTKGKHTYQKLTNTRTVVTAWQRTDESGKHTLYFYSDGTYMRISVSGDKACVDYAGAYTGDTTKNMAITATDWAHYELVLTFTIDGNTLTIRDGEGTPYQFTKI